MSAITKLADSVFGSIPVVLPGAQRATFTFRKHALEIALETRATSEGAALVATWLDSASTMGSKVVMWRATRSSCVAINSRGRRTMSGLPLVEEVNQ